MRKRSLGLAMILAAVLAVVIGVTKPNPFAEKHPYWAVFNTVQGLGSIDRDVRVAGVKVGAITTVERTGDNARVELDLDQDFVLHTDARADMRPHTLFEGSNFVDLSPGSPSAPVLPEGGTIPLERTSNYVTLDEALRILRPQIRDDLRQLARNGARTLRGKAIGGVQRTLKAAPALTHDLAPAMRAAQGPHRRELAGAIRGAAQTVDALARKEDQLIPLTRRANHTIAGLTVDGGAPLDATLAALPGVLQELNDSAPSVGAVVDRLDRLSTAIRPALPALATAVHDTTPVLKRSIPVLRDATPLINDTRLVAARLGAAKGGLVRMFNLINQPLDRFSDALDLLNAPTKLGAPAYRQLVAGSFAGSDGVFSGYQTPAQNPSSPGHTLRVGVNINPAAAGGLAGILGGGLPLAAGLNPLAGAVQPELTPCSKVARVSAKAARALKAEGGCS